jgi:hypothetical protein
LNILFYLFDQSGNLKIYYFAYTFLEYLLFTSIIYVKIQNKTFKRIILIFSILFIAFQIFHFVNIKLTVVDSLPIGVETILLFSYIIFYFYEQFKLPNPDYVYRNPTFWIFFGILIYLGGSFFFNILADYMNKKTVVKLWSLTFIGDIVKNLLFLYALIIIKNHSKNQPHQKKSIPHLDMDFTL